MDIGPGIVRKRKAVGKNGISFHHFSIGGKELPWVSTYKYLGCVVVIDWTAQIWWSVRWEWGLRH